VGAGPLTLLLGGGRSGREFDLPDLGALAAAQDRALKHRGEVLSANDSRGGKLRAFEWQRRNCRSKSPRINRPAALIDLPMLPLLTYAFWTLLFVAVAGLAVAIWVW
jgi:hypothetical protein